MSIELSAKPPYPIKHTGIALIVGCASSVFEELDAAYKFLDDVAGENKPYLIGVNFAPAMVTKCSGLVSCHAEIAFNIFEAIPAGDRPLFHHFPSDQRCPAKLLDGVDYAWNGPPSGAGSSSLPAALIAKKIGFEHIILCGIPLMKIGHIAGYPKSYNSEFSVHPKGKMMNSTVFQRHEIWTKFHKAGMLEGVTSMSGFTRELLGEPRFQKEAV